MISGLQGVLVRIWPALRLLSDRGGLGRLTVPGRFGEKSLSQTAKPQALRARFQQVCGHPFKAPEVPSPSAEEPVDLWAAAAVEQWYAQVFLPRKRRPARRHPWPVLKPAGAYCNQVESALGGSVGEANTLALVQGKTPERAYRPPASLLRSDPGSQTGKPGVKAFVPAIGSFRHLGSGKFRESLRNALLAAATRRRREDGLLPRWALSRGGRSDVADPSPKSPSSRIGWLGILQDAPGEESLAPAQGIRGFSAEDFSARIHSKNPLSSCLC